MDRPRDAAGLSARQERADDRDAVGAGVDAREGVLRADAAQRVDRAAVARQDAR